MARPIFIVATVVVFAVLGIVVAVVGDYNVTEHAFFGGLGGLIIALIATLAGRDQAQT